MEEERERGIELEIQISGENPPGNEKKLTPFSLPVVPFPLPTPPPPPPLSLSLTRARTTQKTFVLSPAERAMDALNYQPLAGRPMRIMWSHRDPAGRRSGVGNVFIKNLDKDIDHKALHDTFSAFGDILSAKVAVDAAGQSKGYGFVHFEKAEAAEAAIEKVNGMLLEGRKVFVGHFVKRDSRPDGGEAKFTNVFLKNLPEGTDEEALLKMCSAFGKVTATC